METKQSNNEFNGRKVKFFGDLEIFHGAYNSKIWMMLIFKTDMALLEILKTYFRFSTAILAYSVNAFFRYRFGVATTGIVMSIMSLSLMLSFNSKLVWIAFKPLIIFINPFLPFLKDKDELYKLIAIDIHSQNLLIFTVFFTVLTLIHTGMIYFKKGNNNLSKRGKSWLYTGLSKFILVNEYFICGVVEPAITISVGLGIWKWGEDIWFGVYLCLAGLAVATQQLIDASHQAHNRLILNM